LSDSTVLRNLGVAFSYSLQAYKALEKGLSRVDINVEALDQELSNHYELLAEPVQTVMRKYDIENPYEKLKELTRGRTVTKSDFTAFIDSIVGLPEDEKRRLRELTPQKYIGYAEKMAKSVNNY
jgi:adenylosuccinate lyase